MEGSLPRTLDFVVRAERNLQRMKMGQIVALVVVWRRGQKHSRSSGDMVGLSDKAARWWKWIPQWLGCWN